MSSKSIADANALFTGALLSEESLKSRLSDIEQFYQMQVKKFDFVSSDGYKLTAVGINHHDSPFSVPLVIIPGRGEIAHKYAELLYSLSSIRLNTYVLFARGQGESQRLLADRQRCHLESFEVLRQDIAQMLSELGISRYMLMGFSLGGLISLDLIKNGQHPPLRCCLIAPFLWPYFKAPAPLLYAFVTLLGSLPYFKYAYTPHGSAYRKVPFEQNYHSHCQTRYEGYHGYYAAHPELTIGGPTYAFVKECVKKQSELFGSSFAFKLPLCVYLCGEDRVVSSEKAEQFFKAHRGDGPQLVINQEPQVFHDVLNELDSYRTRILSGGLTFLFGE